MKRVVSISLGSSLRDYQITVKVLGQHVEVRRIGTNGDVAQAMAPNPIICAPIRSAIRAALIRRR